MKPLRYPICLVVLLTSIGCATQPKQAASLYQPGRWGGSPVVQTVYGLVEGMRDAEGTWAWKGIPYAAPPVGQLRWKAPRPPVPWQGIRKADRFGKMSAQIVPVLGLMGSEDCLFLNVWRPQTGESGLPVYVFVHGGGNSIGKSSLRDYFGYAVAARSNMVYVSLNYRLSALGWFRLPALAEGESPLDASGNYGTLDIIAALQWVQENIAAFGGDPARVTVAGESAGAFNVLSLLTSGQARGLFQRAVAESGIAVMQSPGTAERAARTITLRLLMRAHKAGSVPAAEALLDSMSSVEVRSFLYSVSASDLLRTLDRSPLGLAMADHPTVYADGTVLPSEGYRVFRDGTYPNKVPFIIGTNKDEMKLFMFFTKQYRHEPALYDAVAAWRSAVWRYAGCDYVAQAITARDDHPPVYAYRFDWGSPDASGASPLPGNLGRRLGAFHSTELPFFLGTGVNSVSIMTGRFLTPANEAGRKVLTRAAMSYLAAFARTGDPNDTPGSRLPRWDPWDPADNGFKALVMDVEGTGLRFSALRSIPSLESLKARASGLPAGVETFGLLSDFAELSPQP